MLHHDFRRFLDALGKLSPAQIEDAQTKILDLRRKSEAISEIEARTNEEHKCPFCGDERRQKWGSTRTNIQRYRCCGCRKTYSGRTGSAFGRIHRPDLFMEALRDMLCSPAPQSVRKLAKQLDLNKYTIWRWRMLVFSIIGNSGVAATFSGIIEADETTNGSPGRDRANGSGTLPIRRISRSTASTMGRIYDKRVENDARSVEVAAPHSHSR